MLDGPRALSIRQPWAQAIIDGPKRIENRTWKPKGIQEALGRRIMIHTSATFDSDDDGHAKNLRYLGLYDFDEDRAAFGAIIGSVKLVGWVDTNRGREFGFLTEYRDQWATRDRSPSEAVMNDPWWQGPVGWVFAEPRRYPKPIRHKGQLQLWRPKDRAIERAVEYEKGFTDDKGAP